ncbi:MAG: hypothetical protein LW710_07025 [Burkholderiales bacterium]|nr:hypothetical protein [Burkholderiales bacterium]
MGFSPDTFYRYQHAKEKGVWRLCLKPIDVSRMFGQAA